MLLSDRPLDGLTQRYLVYLNQIHKSFIFSNPCDLPIDDIPDLHIETLHREFVLDIETAPLIFAEDPDDRGIDIVLMDVQPLKQLFLRIFSYFLTNGHSLVDKLIHLI